MTVVKQFTTSADFWAGMVVPDCYDSRVKLYDLRLALHAASSLFHMSDWVFHTHQSYVEAHFTFADDTGTVKPVRAVAQFANSLEQSTSDFGLIRGIANASKHLTLTNVRPVANAPSHAANLSSKSTGGGAFGESPIGSMAIGAVGITRVVLEAAGGDLDYSTIRDNVYRMWEQLKTQHGW